MTGIYQVCDTHINGVIKQKLSQFWSEQTRIDPDHAVPLNKMIAQTEHILDHLSKSFIRDAFDETAFTPAHAFMINDDNQVQLAMDEMIESIENNELSVLYDDIMKAFGIVDDDRFNEMDVVDSSDDHVDNVASSSDDDVVDNDNEDDENIHLDDDSDVAEECNNDEAIALALAGM
jgi:hypothetical protein